MPMLGEVGMPRQEVALLFTMMQGQRSSGSGEGGPGLINYLQFVELVRALCAHIRAPRP
jgi:hypothetical protein